MAIDGSRIRREIVQILQDHNGKPCPSNLKLSALLGISTRRVSDFLFLLAREGVIEKHGQQYARSFTVVETGERTLAQIPTAPVDLPKYSPEKIYSVKAAPLPPHVWYGRYNQSGNRIDDQGIPIDDHPVTGPIQGIS